MISTKSLYWMAAHAILLWLTIPTQAVALTCLNDTTPFTHAFDSGAAWEMCWSIDENAGLTLTEVNYGPPAEPSTKILQSASLAQILFKYDEDIVADRILTDHGLGGDNHVPPNAGNCPLSQSHSNDQGSGICTRLRDLNTMTTVRRTQTLRRHEISLHAFSQAGSQTYEQVWRFSEDGKITPAVRLSGELDRFTKNSQYGSAVTQDGPLASNATLLYTWRLDFNIGNTPNNDIIEQIEFIPYVTNVVRRSITNTILSTESFHKVHRTQFRGWLFRDSELSAGISGTTRMGYYLDPQSSGFDYISRKNNWALFDLSVTRNNDCEQLALGNARNHPGCGDGLDQFVDGESLVNQDPVVWFSLARQLLPKSEDYPAISTREASFKLIPFDWSASTPFTPITE